MGRDRDPTPEELELWRKTMRGTQKMSSKDWSLEVQPSASSSAKRPKNLSKNALRMGISLPPRPDLPKTLPQKPISQNANPLSAIDRKTGQKVKRGQLKPEAQLDLHGFRRSDAHGALDLFIARCYDQGKKMVLVITGKGASPYSAPKQRRHRTENDFEFRDRGVLKTKVPLWLETPTMRSMVHSVQEAHPRHGGSGALYVFIRQKR